MYIIILLLLYNQCCKASRCSVSPQQIPDNRTKGHSEEMCSLINGYTGYVHVYIYIHKYIREEWSYNSGCVDVKWTDRLKSSLTAVCKVWTELFNKHASLSQTAVLKFLHCYYYYCTLMNFRPEDHRFMSDSVTSVLNAAALWNYPQLSGLKESHSHHKRRCSPEGLWTSDGVNFTV